MSFFEQIGKRPKPLAEYPSDDEADKRRLNVRANRAQGSRSPYTPPLGSRRSRAADSGRPSTPRSWESTEAESNYSNPSAAGRLNPPDNRGRNSVELDVGSSRTSTTESYKVPSYYGDDSIHPNADFNPSGYQAKQSVAPVMKSARLPIVREVESPTDPLRRSEGKKANYGDLRALDDTTSSSQSTERSRDTRTRDAARPASRKSISSSTKIENFSKDKDRLVSQVANTIEPKGGSWKSSTATSSKSSSTAKAKESEFRSKGVPSTTSKQTTSYRDSREPRAEDLEALSLEDRYTGSNPVASRESRDKSERDQSARSSAISNPSYERAQKRDLPSITEGSFVSEESFERQDARTFESGGRTRKQPSANSSGNYSPTTKEQARHKLGSESFEVVLIGPSRREKPYTVKPKINFGRIAGRYERLYGYDPAECEYFYNKRKMNKGKSFEENGIPIEQYMGQDNGDVVEIIVISTTGAAKTQPRSRK